MELINMFGGALVTFIVSFVCLAGFGYAWLSDKDIEVTRKHFIWAAYIAGTFAIGMTLMTL